MSIKTAPIVHSCYDCGCLWFGAYMVTDEVWNLAWPEYEQLRRDELFRRRLHKESQLRFLDLCLLDLERRLGRQLTIDDFTGAPVNDSIRFAYDMGKRAGGK